LQITHLRRWRCKDSTWEPPFPCACRARGAPRRDGGLTRDETSDARAGSASESKSGSRQGRSLNKNFSAAWSSVLRLRILDVTAAMARSEGIADADGLSGFSVAAGSVVRAGRVSYDAGFIGGAAGCKLMTVRWTGGKIESATNSANGIPSALQDGGGTAGAGEGPRGLRENPGQKTWARGRPVAVPQAGSGVRDWKG
jgi:hypothetical protein